MYWIIFWQSHCCLSFLLDLRQKAHWLIWDLIIFWNRYNNHKIYYFMKWYITKNIINNTKCDISIRVATIIAVFFSILRLSRRNTPEIFWRKNLPPEALQEFIAEAKGPALSQWPISPELWKSWTAQSKVAIVSRFLFSQIKLQGLKQFLASISFSLESQ